MSIEFLLAALAFVTIMAVIVFAIRGKNKVEEKRDDPTAPKSALAADGPTGRVEDRL